MEGPVIMTGRESMVLLQPCGRAGRTRGSYVHGKQGHFIGACPGVSEQGMSLVEVLVGLLLLAFIALGVMTFLGSVMKQNQLSLERSIATGIASERIQQITSMPYQTSANFAKYKLPEETATAGTPATLTTPVGSVPGEPRYSRTVTLTYDQPVTGMLTVRVDIAWQSLSQGVQKTHRMITYLDPGLEQGQ